MVAVMNHHAEVEIQVMAQIHLQHLYPFNFNYPNDWLCWERRFEQLHVASGLQDESAKQLSTLLYCLGEENKAVFSPTNATQEEQKVYNTVHTIKTFDAFLKV